MEGSIQSALLHLDPIEGKLTLERTPALNLDSLLQGSYNMDSLFSSQLEQQRDKISLKQISEQVAGRVAEPHKVENLIDSLVDEICGPGDDDASCLTAIDPGELRKVLEEERITEGLELLDKVDDLQTKLAVVTRKTQLLEFNLWDVTEKIQLLQAKVRLQEQQIVEAQSRQQEQDAVLLSPMRSIYLRHFHDQVRQGICEKLSASPLFAQRGCGQEHIFEIHNLWRFTHGVSPQMFSKWNQFVDKIVQDQEVVALLGLSPQAIRITRFEQDGEETHCQCSEEFASALRNKHVFAELVTRLGDEQRGPLYSELYEFLFNARPETMNFTVIGAAIHP